MYCTKCGKKLVQGESIGYDRETGTQRFKYACPTDKCDHTGVEHNLVSVPWYIPFYDEKCTKCNRKFSNYF